MAALVREVALATVRHAFVLAGGARPPAAAHTEHGRLAEAVASIPTLGAAVCRLSGPADLAGCHATARLVAPPYAAAVDLLAQLRAALRVVIADLSNGSAATGVLADRDPRSGVGADAGTALPKPGARLARRLALGEHWALPILTAHSTAAVAILIACLAPHATQGCAEATLDAIHVVAGPGTTVGIGATALAGGCAGRARIPAFSAGAAGAAAVLVVVAGVADHGASRPVSTGTLLAREGAALGGDATALFQRQAGVLGTDLDAIRALLAAIGATLGRR